MIHVKELIGCGAYRVPFLPKSDHQSLETLSVIDVLLCSCVPD